MKNYQTMHEILSNILESTTNDMLTYGYIIQYSRKKVKRLEGIFEGLLLIDFARLLDEVFLY